MAGVVGVWKIVKEYTGYATVMKDCKCPFCDEEALLKKTYSMDGVSIDLYPSNYCPNCGAKLLCFDKEENNERTSESKEVEERN